MDVYDPACPTEDDLPFEEIDLSQVPLPPTLPLQGDVHSREASSLPSELGREDKRKGRKKKRKNRNDRSQPEEAEAADKEDEQASDQCPVLESTEPVFNDGTDDIPVLVPVLSIDSDDTALADLSERDPPVLVRPELATAEVPAAVTSSAPTTKPGKLHFKLTPDPNSGKAKVSFQLKKSLKSTFHAAEDDGEEEGKRVVEEEVKDIVEKTAAGEYIPTRFKVSKKHEIYRPSLVEPGISIVFPSPVISFGGAPSSAAVQAAKPSTTPLADARFSHEVSEDTDDAVGVRDSKQNEGTKSGRETRFNRREEDNKAAEKDQGLVDSPKELRRSERRDKNKEESSVEKNESTSRSTRRSSRGGERDVERHGSLRSSHSRKEHSDGKYKGDDDKSRKGESLETSEKWRSSRSKRPESDTRKEGKRSPDRRHDDDNKHHSHERSPRHDRNASPSITGGRRTRSSHRNRSPSKERDHNTHPSSETLTPAKDAVVQELAADRLTEELPLDGGCSDRVAEVSSAMKQSDIPLIDTSSEVLEIKTTVELEEKHPHIQKIVIRRSLESNDFEIARNDLNENNSSEDSHTDQKSVVSEDSHTNQKSVTSEDSHHTDQKSLASKDGHTYHQKLVTSEDSHTDQKSVTSKDSHPTDQKSVTSEDSHTNQKSVASEDSHTQHKSIGSEDSHKNQKSVVSEDSSTNQKPAMHVDSATKQKSFVSEKKPADKKDSLPSGLNDELPDSPGKEKYRIKEKVNKFETSDTSVPQAEHRNSKEEERPRPVSPQIEFYHTGVNDKELAGQKLHDKGTCCIESEDANKKSSQMDKFQSFSDSGSSDNAKSESSLVKDLEIAQLPEPAPESPILPRTSLPVSESELLSRSSAGDDEIQVLPDAGSMIAESQKLVESQGIHVTGSDVLQEISCHAAGSEKLLEKSTFVDELSQLPKGSSHDEESRKMSKKSLHVEESEMLPERSKYVGESERLSARSKNIDESKKLPAKSKHFDVSEKLPPRSKHFNESEKLPAKSKHFDESEKLPTRSKYTEESEKLPTRSKYTEESEKLPTRSKYTEESEKLPTRSKYTEESEKLPTRSKYTEESEKLPAKSKHIEESEKLPAKSKHIEESEKLPAKSKHIEESEKLPAKSKHIEESEKLPAKSKHIEESEKLPAKTKHIEETEKLSGRSKNIDESEKFSSRSKHIEESEKLPARRRHVEESENLPTRSKRRIEESERLPEKNSHIYESQKSSGRKYHTGELLNVSVRRSEERNPYRKRSMSPESRFYGRKSFAADTEKVYKKSTSKDGTQRRPEKRLYISEPAPLLVDVSALPGKSKWEMDDYDEEDVEEKPENSVSVSEDRHLVKDFRLMDVFHTRPVHTQKESIPPRQSQRSLRVAESNSNEDDISLDHKRHADKKKDKGKKLKKKRKHEHDTSSDNTEPAKTTEDKIVVKSKEEPARFDNSKIVSYLKEYSKKEEKTSKAKTEIDSVKLVAYLKEYSGKMVAESSLCDALDSEGGPATTKELPLKRNTKDDFSPSKSSLVAEQDQAEDDFPQGKDALDKQKEQSSSDPKGQQYDDVATIQKAEVEEFVQKGAKDESDIVSGFSRSSSQESSQKERNKERLTKKKDESSAASKEKRGRSASSERSGESASKSSQRSRDRRDRSDSLEGSRRNKRQRSHSKDRQDEKRRIRRRSRSHSPAWRGRDRRNRSRSLSQDRRSDRRNRSKSPSQDARNDRRNRSSSLSQDRKSDRRNKSRSPSKDKWSDRRNRSRSQSQDKRSDRRNKSPSQDRKSDRRNRSLSRTRDRNYSYRSYRSPGRESYNRTRRDKREGRGRSRSDSYEKSSTRRRRSSESSPSKSTKHRKKSKSPDRKGRETSLGAKSDRKYDMEQKLKLKVPSPVSLTSIPIPDEITMPHEEAKKGTFDREEKEMKSTKETGNIDKLQDESVKISEKEETIVTNTEDAVISVKTPMPEQTEAMKTGTVTKTENPATLAYGRDRQIKFSILGASKKLQSVLISGMPVDGEGDSSDDKEEPLEKDKLKSSVLDNDGVLRETDKDGDIADKKHAELDRPAISNMHLSDEPQKEDKEDVFPANIDDMKDSELLDNKENDITDDSEESPRKITTREKETPISPKRLKFKYIPLWEMEETEKRPVFEEVTKKTEKSFGLALDYGSGSSDYDDDEGSVTKQGAMEISNDKDSVTKQGVVERTDDKDSVTKQRVVEILDDKHSVTKQRVVEIPGDKRSVTKQGAMEISNDKDSVTKQGVVERTDDKDSVTKEVVVEIADDRDSVTKKGVMEIPDDKDSVTKEVFMEIPDDKNSVTKQVVVEIPEDKDSVTKQGAIKIPEDEDPVKKNEDEKSDIRSDSDQNETKKCAKQEEPAEGLTEHSKLHTFSEESDPKLDKDPPSIQHEAQSKAKETCPDSQSVTDLQSDNLNSGEVSLEANKEAYSPSHPSMEDADDDFDTSGTDSQLASVVGSRPANITSSNVKRVSPGLAVSESAVPNIITSVSKLGTSSNLPVTVATPVLMNAPESINSINIASIPLPGMPPTALHIPHIPQPVNPQGGRVPPAVMLPSLIRQPFSGLQMPLSHSSLLAPPLPAPKPVPPPAPHPSLPPAPHPALPPAPHPALPPAPHPVLPPAPHPVLPPAPHPVLPPAPYPVLPPAPHPVLPPAPHPVLPPAPHPVLPPAPYPVPLPAAVSQVQLTNIPLSTSSAPRPVPPPPQLGAASSQLMMSFGVPRLSTPPQIPLPGHPPVGIPGRYGVPPPSCLSAQVPGVQGVSLPGCSFMGVAPVPPPAAETALSTLQPVPPPAVGSKLVGTQPSLGATLAGTIPLPGVLPGRTLPVGTGPSNGALSGGLLPAAGAPPTALPGLIPSTATLSATEALLRNTLPSVSTDSQPAAPSLVPVETPASAVQLPHGVTVNSVTSGTPPLRFRINRFHQSPPVTLAIPPPSIAIPVASTLGASISVAKTTASVPLIPALSSVQQPATSTNASPTSRDSKLVTAVPVPSQKLAIERPITTAHSKRPKISSILSQPKVEDPSVLNTEVKMAPSISKSDSVGTTDLPAEASVSSEKRHPQANDSKVQKFKSDISTSVDGHIHRPKDDEHGTREEKPTSSDSVVRDCSAELTQLPTQSSERDIKVPQTAISSTSHTASQDDFPFSKQLKVRESIPLPEEVTSSVDSQKSPAGSPHPSQEPALPKPPSSPPKQPPPPPTAPESDSPATSEAASKSQIVSSTQGDKKKRFSQSPLAIGMLPKVQITQSPLAAGPLPKLPPEPEENNAAALAKRKVSSPGAAEAKATTLSQGAKQKKVETQSTSKVHFVFKSKTVVQKTLIPAFDDEESDNEDEPQMSTSEASHSEKNIMSALPGDKNGAPQPLPAPPVVVGVSVAAAADTEKQILEKEVGTKEVAKGKETKSKTVSLTDIEAFPVQVITSSRKEEDTAASSWPEFAVAKKRKDEESGSEAKRRSRDRDDRKKSKRSSHEREKDEDHEHRRKRNKYVKEEEKKFSSYKRGGSRSDEEDENDYDSGIKIKKEKEDSYEDSWSGGQDSKSSDQRKANQHDDDDRRRGRDKDSGSYSKRKNRYDDNESDYKRRGRDTKEEKYTRRREDRDDDYTRRRYDDSRKSRHSERGRSRERSWERDRSHERGKGDRSSSKSSGKRHHRNRDESRSRSRSKSPSRRIDRSRDHSRDRYDRRRDRDRSLSRSRSHSQERGSARRKDSKTFKEELLEELTKPCTKADHKEDLFKVATIVSSNQTYVPEYQHDPSYPSVSDGSMYPLPHHTPDLSGGYPGQDFNLAAHYPPSYEHQEFTSHWQEQPAHTTYNQMLPPQHQEIPGQYPPIPPEQVPTSHPYPFQTPHFPPPNFQNNQVLTDPYHPVPSILQQQLPQMQHPVSGPPPPAHIHMNQHRQPFPHHYPPSMQVPPPAYTLSAPPNSFQPHIFTQETRPPVTQSNFHLHSGPRPRPPLLPTPVTVLRLPQASQNIVETASFSAPDVVSSPGLQMPPESRPPRKSRFSPLEEGTFSPLKTSLVAASSSPTVGSPSTTSMVKGEETYAQSAVSASNDESAIPEPSFETSLLAESEFDSVDSRESKKSSAAKKKSSLEVNEPIVSSSGVEDSTGDTGSDSGTESSSQKPLKVKSRWRSNSEADAVVVTSKRLSSLAKQLVDHGSPTPHDSSDLSSYERCTRSRTAAVASAAELDSANLVETPSPSSPSRKRAKTQFEIADLPEKQENDDRVSPEDESNDMEEDKAEEDLASIVARPDFPKFEIITENIHLTDRKRSKSMKRMLCDCTTSRVDRSKGITPCGSDCLNRMLMIECGYRCPCGDYCTNKRFQKKQYSRTLPFKAGDKGWGLRAQEDMEESGTFIMEYVGELLGYEEFVRRTRQYSKAGLIHHYFMALNGDEVIDATLKGSISRFINHSCDPNCETQKWTVNGELRVGFFTRKPIKKGEELTFDYQFEHYGEAQKCYCGAENCRGYIGLVKSPTRNNRKKEKKKKEIFKDELLEEDIEELSLLDGMRNKNHVLDLCRLMVRAEKVQHRMAILKILQDTTESACLRLFLDYHGLPLLWSWMADIGTADYSAQTQELKLLMLSVLKGLPITNKTALKESKIPDVVERWAFAAVVAARKPPPPPPPATTATTLVTMSTNVADSVANTTTTLTDNEAIAVSAPVTSVHEAASAIEDTEKAAAVEPEATTSSESSPPASPPPLIPSLNTVTPVSILASAKASKDAKGKRRVTFAEMHEESTFSPEPHEDMDENDDISSSTQGTGDTDDLEGKAAERLLQCELKSEDNLSSNMADSTSSSGSASDTDNSDTEALIKDPLASLAAECISQWSSLKEVFKIPKRVRVEERKKTEMELDVLYKKDLETSDPYAKWKGSKVRSRKKALDEDDRKSSAPKMSKEERRQLFEAQVKKEDEMAAQAYAEEYQRQQEAYVLHQQRLLDDPQYFYFHQQQQGDPSLAGLDPSMIPPEGLQDPHTGQSIPNETVVDPNTGQPVMDPNMGQPVIDHNIVQPLMHHPSHIDPNTGQPVLHHIDPQIGQPALHHIDPQTGQPVLHHIDPQTGQPVLHHIDPQTGQPVLHHIDPQTGQPVLHHIDPQTGQPILHHIDPQTGQPVLHHIDPQTGQPVLHHIDPQTGQPVLHHIDPQTGQPVLHHFDPQTGQPVLHHIDPQTGQPVLHHIDPQTGQPVHQMDQLTGQPIPPQIDPMTGQLLQHPVEPLMPHPNLQHVPQFDPSIEPPHQHQHPGLGQTASLNFQPQQQPQPQHLPAPPQNTNLLEIDFEEEVPPPPSPPTVPVTKLPPNWKTAKDAEGRVYYYHAFTRQTQWEMPSWEDNEYDSDDMDIDPISVDEVIKTKKKTTTAAADTSSEVARKIKDQFRSKMSPFIVCYLNPYRKQDCKIGRIVSTDDFKHLARKLTHHVMSKELKHCRHVEDLEVNENVKAKAKDYVRKYMSKFGTTFKKTGSPHPDDP